VTDRRDDGPTTFVREVKKPGQGDGDLRAIAPALTILWHYNLERIGQRAALGRRRTEVARGSAPFHPVIDAPLSRAPFLIVEYHEGSATLTPGGSRTSVLVDGAPLTGPLQIDPGRLKRGVILLLAERIVVCLHQLRTPPLPGPDLGFVGSSDVMEEVRRQIRQVADLNVPVLIRGQSGTGKELVARAIAAASKTPTPFVALNMAKLAPELAAAELFGHEKGAYTGAAIDRPGYFVEADGGTLFLDEIGDASLQVQKSLLRVVEEGRVRPLGGRKDREVRVRLLTATDKDLDARVGQGTFDWALLNRISGYCIDLPTLADRREDIGVLLLHFLRQQLESAGELHRLASCQVDERPWLGAFDVMRIARAAFPGNLRSLMSLANAIVVDSRRKPFAVLGRRAEEILAARAVVPTTSPVEAAARRPGQPTDDEIRAALRQHHNNVSPAAKQLGISRPTLYERARGELALLRSIDDLTNEEILDAHARHRGDLDAMAVELGVSPKPLKARLAAALKTRR
jgi:two-component system nitrogen regulation response regulator GlnG